MFESKKYEVVKADAGHGPADMIRILLDDKDAYFLTSNTSLGLIPKQGSSAICEYILMKDYNVKYMSEIKKGEEVIVKKGSKISSCKIIEIENIKISKLDSKLQTSVETERKLFDGSPPGIHENASANSL